jgi:hypothetical protein
VANRRALVRDLSIARLRLLDEHALAALGAESRSLIPAFEALERTLLGTCEQKTVARARSPNDSVVLDELRIQRHLVKDLAPSPSHIDPTPEADSKNQLAVANS